jgi:hypothetical protein
MADSSGALADTAECAPAPAPPSWHLQAAAAAHRLSHLLTYAPKSISGALTASGRAQAAAPA